MKHYSTTDKLIIVLLVSVIALTAVWFVRQVGPDFFERRDIYIASPQTERPASQTASANKIQRSPTPMPKFKYPEYVNPDWLLTEEGECGYSIDPSAYQGWSGFVYTNAAGEFPARGPEDNRSVGLVKMPLGVGESDDAIMGCMIMDGWIDLQTTTTCALGDDPRVLQAYWAELKNLSACY